VKKVRSTLRQARGEDVLVLRLSKHEARPTAIEFTNLTHHIALTMAGLDPAIHGVCGKPCWMAGSAAGHGEKGLLPSPWPGLDPAIHELRQRS
jgi:hypothetical protein